MSPPTHPAVAAAAVSLVVAGITRFSDDEELASDDEELDEGVADCTYSIVLTLDASAGQLLITFCRAEGSHVACDLQMRMPTVEESVATHAHSHANPLQRPLLEKHVQLSV